uniref:Rho termination factor N-terminal domain-containing protein n=1 Tax=Panagrolaimus sp. JU765 TaxID=591449 RepID=A0AC34Q7L1_9BILA
MSELNVSSTDSDGEGIPLTVPKPKQDKGKNKPQTKKTAMKPTTSNPDDQIASNENLKDVGKEGSSFTFYSRETLQDLNYYDLKKIAADLRERTGCKSIKLNDKKPKLINQICKSMDFLRISNDEQSQEKDDVSENGQIKLYSKEQLQSMTYKNLRDVAREVRDKTGDHRIKLNSEKKKLVGQVLDAQQSLKSQNNDEKENADISDSRDPLQVDEDGLVNESSDERQADLSIDRKSSTGPVLDEVQTILPAEEQVVLKRISVDVVVEPKQSSQSPVRRSSLEQVLFSSSHIDTNNTETQNDSTNSEEPFLFDMSNASDPLSVSALGGKTFIIEKKCAVESEVDNSNQRNIFDGNDLFATPKLNSQVGFFVFFKRQIMFSEIKIVSRICL